MVGRTESEDVMGILEAVKTSIQRSVAGGDIAQQVKAMYEEATEDIKKGGLKVEPGYEKRLTPVFAACVTERGLLDSAEMLVEQLQADGRRALPTEVKTRVVETIRDLKMKALEADGCVNPLDLAAIRLSAVGVKGKARTYQLSARMNGAKEPGPTLDAV